MSPVPQASPVTGKPVGPGYIHTQSASFVSHPDGRKLLLRGINLSGASKAPVGMQSHLLDGLWESVEDPNNRVSFVDRPLSLSCSPDSPDYADVHLARLRGWGFNFLRFPVTWEALEWEGPGKYDVEYMDYLVRILRKCKEWGFRVFLDPHQDTWSRFAGGSGAPFWTLHAAGLDPRNFTATQAAIIHSEYIPPTAKPDPSTPIPDPGAIPAMIWSTNYGRLVSQTMYTLFFAGEIYAPKCILDGVNIQTYLQTHFINACAALAQHIRRADDALGPDEQYLRLADECVIGWDTLNEPSEGLIGWPDISKNPEAQGSTLKKGTYPTPIQGMRLGMGQVQTVDNYSFGAFGPKRDGSVTVDPKGLSIWANAERLGEDDSGKSKRWGWTRSKEWSNDGLGKCLWAWHGVWDIETGFVLSPFWFILPTGNPQTTTFPDSSPLGVLTSDAPNEPQPQAEPAALPQPDYNTLFFLPHLTAYTKRIREWHEDAIIFVQPPVFAIPPDLRLVVPGSTEDILQGRACYSPHYYDGLTLVSRHWNWFNADALGLLRGMYKHTMGAVKIGETAIRKSLQEQLGILKSDAVLLGHEEEELRPPVSSSDAPVAAYPASDALPKIEMAKYPTLIGEIGTPFDMDGKRAYYDEKWKGNYSGQTKALDASLNATDGPNALNFTMWTYCSDGSHDWGDGWNGEDLGLWTWDDVHALPGSEQTDASLYQLDPGDETQVSLHTIDPLSGKRGGKNVKVDVRTAGASSLSLTQTMAASKTSLLNGSASTATLTAAEKLLEQEEERRRLRHLDIWQRSPYIFLTSGARAYQAFSRPYPIAVVGTIRDAAFEISKGKEGPVYKCVVSVRQNDLPADSDVPEVPTEIFVPFIHYANPRFLPSGDGADSKELNLIDSRLYSPDWEGSGSTSANSSPTLTSAIPASSSNRPGQSSSSKIGSSLLAGSDWLSLDVRISSSAGNAGRWEVDGQILKWWYAAPSTPDADYTYTIEIRRSGGGIAHGLGKGSWTESICPEEACVIC